MAARIHDSFNSTMVRLKVKAGGVFNKSESSFNSTMVRLKEAHIKMERVDPPEFQFHNGSIKSDSLGSLHRCQLSFQFHNGSIKSTPSCPLRTPQHTFQFHNGSIKRTGRLKPFLPSCVGFNSTMVRLKVLYPKTVHKILPCFNSTMVRLKESSRTS